MIIKPQLMFQNIFIRHAQKKNIYIYNHHSRTNHLQSNDDDIQYFFFFAICLLHIFFL